MQDMTRSELKFVKACCRHLDGLQLTKYGDLCPKACFTTLRLPLEGIASKPLRWLISMKMNMDEGQ